MLMAVETLQVGDRPLGGRAVDPQVRKPPVGEGVCGSGRGVPLKQIEDLLVRIAVRLERPAERQLQEIRMIRVLGEVVSKRLIVDLDRRADHRRPAVGNERSLSCPGVGGTADPPDQGVGDRVEPRRGRGAHRLGKIGVHPAKPVLELGQRRSGCKPPRLDLVVGPDDELPEEMLLGDPQGPGHRLLMADTVKVEADQPHQGRLAEPLVHELDHPVTLAVGQCTVSGSFRPNKGPLQLIEIQQISRVQRPGQHLASLEIARSLLHAHRRRLRQPVGDPVAGAAERDGVCVLVADDPQQVERTLVL